MPEVRLKREDSEPGNQEVGNSNPLISALLKRRLELICSEMSASGALIAIRDQEGARCLVSTGDAPVVGSRLQADSGFTRACLETGEVVICEDAARDSRIHPSVARALHLRSAVAVPIQAQGSVLGVIEVFSPRPSNISPVDVAHLKEVASLFALSLARGSSPNGTAVSRGSMPLAAQAASPAAEEPWEAQQSVSANWFATKPRFAVERPVDSPPVEPASGPPASLSQRSARKSTTAQMRRGRGATLSFLGIVLCLLFFSFLFRTSRPMSVTTFTNSVVPPAAAWTKRGVAKPGPTEADAKSKVRMLDLKR